MVKEVVTEDVKEVAMEKIEEDIKVAIEKKELNTKERIKDMKEKMKKSYLAIEVDIKEDIEEVIEAQEVVVEEEEVKGVKWYIDQKLKELKLMKERLLK